MEEQIGISSEIKQRLDAYCSESNRPFDLVLRDALCFFISKKKNGGSSESDTAVE